MGEEKEISLEEAFTRLQETIENLEKDDITLEQSFQEYQKGMLLVRRYSKKISSGRGRVSEKSDRGHELQCSGRRKKTQTGIDEGELSSVWRAGRSDRAFYGSS